MLPNFYLPLEADVFLVTYIFCLRGLRVYVHLGKSTFYKMVSPLAL